MPTFDLALGLRVIRTASGMRHAALAEILTKLTRHIRGAVVAEKTRSVLDAHLLDTRDCQRLVERLRDIGRAATLELSKMRVVCMPSMVRTRCAA